MTREEALEGLGFWISGFTLECAPEGTVVKAREDRWDHYHLLSPRGCNHVVKKLRIVPREVVTHPLGLPCLGFMV